MQSQTTLPLRRNRVWAKQSVTASSPHASAPLYGFLPDMRDDQRKLNVRGGGTELIGVRRISAPPAKRGVVIDAASILDGVICATQQTRKSASRYVRGACADVFVQWWTQQFENVKSWSWAKAFVPDRASRGRRRWSWVSCWSPCTHQRLLAEFCFQLWGNTAWMDHSTYWGRAGKKKNSLRSKFSWHEKSLGLFNLFWFWHCPPPFSPESHWSCLFPTNPCSVGSLWRNGLYKAHWAVFSILPRRFHY